MSTPKLLHAGTPSVRWSLVGRDDALGRLGELVECGARIITVLGPPGIGKTSLARAFIARSPHVFTEACFCDLSSAKSKDDLLFAALSLFGERARVAQGELESRASELLSQAGPMLVVLDNFEQLTFAAAVVERWCAAAPELVVIVTSRERLAIAGEVVVELPPLACPDENASESDVVTSDAVRLFLARAHAAGGSVDGAASTPAETTQGALLSSSPVRGAPALLGALVRRLDGIPLAIELAAARTRLLPLAELARRLNAGTEMLGRTTVHGPDRHATLTKAIAWSWNLLSDAEKITLARLSVFAGGFDLAAAETVTESTADVVAALREKSLVHARRATRAVHQHPVLRFEAARRTRIRRGTSSAS